MASSAAAAAAPTAAAQPPPPPSPSPLLDGGDDVLSHPALAQSLDVVARLLCTSRRARRCVADACRGQLALACATGSPEDAERVLAWLRRHAALLRSCDVEWNAMRWTPDWEQKAADALAAAAGSPLLPLPLTSFKSNVAGPPQLRALPAAALTRLHLGSLLTRRQLDPAKRSLAGLTSLRELVLESPSQQVLPALASMTQLTLLNVLVRELRAHATALRFLPPSLLEVELHVGYDPGSSSSAVTTGSSAHADSLLPLGHLTALTRLGCSSQLQLRAGDVLPPATRALVLPDSPVAAPLLPLTQLQSLTLDSSTAPADELLRVAAELQGTLREVQLAYAGADPHAPGGAAGAGAGAGAGNAAVDVDASAGAWPSLPLKSMELSGGRRGLRVCWSAFHRLGACTQLERLVLVGAQLPDVGVGHVAEVVAQLRRLREFRLAGVELRGAQAYLLPQQQQQQQQQGLGQPPPPLPPPVAAAAAGGGGSDGGGDSARALMAALAALPELSDLRVGGLRFDRGDALELTRAAGRLTALHLVGVGLRDDDVRALVAALPGLEALDLADNGAVSDAALAACTADALPKLRHLDVSNCLGVGQEAVAAFRRRRRDVELIAFEDSEEDDGEIELCSD